MFSDVYTAVSFIGPKESVLFLLSPSIYGRLNANVPNLRSVYTSENVSRPLVFMKPSVCVSPKTGHRDMCTN